jgi:two-component system phosphate regulon sensor histidine kinase PhoR
MGFWWRPLGVLAGVLLVAAMIWSAAGAAAALGFLAGIQALVMLRRLWQEFRLARWLENPDEVTPPDATGTWGDIFYRLEKLQRRQKASRSELSNALEQFEHAAMAVPDGMVILNRSDQIDWCNPASRKYLGLDCQRDRGQFVRYLLRQANFLEFLDASDYSRRLVCKSPINRETILSLQLVPFGEAQKLLVRASPQPEPRPEWRAWWPGLALLYLGLPLQEHLDRHFAQPARQHSYPFAASVRAPYQWRVQWKRHRHR